MSGVRDIKRRINSIKNIQQITKAMKVVSAAKLHRTQAAVLASRPYVGKLDEILSRIVSTAREYRHPLMEVRPVNKVGIILITSDRGLAGGYNSNIIKKTITEAVRLDSAEVSYIAVGRKGRDYLRRRGKRLRGEFIGIQDIPKFWEAHGVAKLAVELFETGEFDEVYLAYQEFASAVHQKPVFKKLLPISSEYQGREAEQSLLYSEYIYEPAPEEVLDVLIPKHVNNLVFEVLREAKASEFGAQMVSMTSATDNAKKIIDELTLSFNRARQTAITTEITEIVGGANALQDI